MRERYVVEGQLTRLERFEPPDRGGRLRLDGHLSDACYRLYLDGADDPVGWIHSSKVLNRVAKGDRVRLWLKPGDDRVRRLRPADRKLKWYQH